MKKIQISPSILSADFSQLGNEIKRLEEGGADMIHVDVMDGHFVPNLTMGPQIIKTLRKYTKLPFDVHLMISPVHKYIKDYADAGADIITIHPEATESLKNSIEHIKSLNKKVGVSLNPESKINLIIQKKQLGTGDAINVAIKSFQKNSNILVLYGDVPLTLSSTLKQIIKFRKDENSEMKSVRFRTLGCYPLTGAVESTASNLVDIIQEVLSSTKSERDGRAIDQDQGSSMEQKKRQGYF